MRPALAVMQPLRSGSGSPRHVPKPKPENGRPSAAARERKGVDMKIWSNDPKRRAIGWALILAGAITAVLAQAVQAGAIR